MLGALFIVCALRPLLVFLRVPLRYRGRPRRVSGPSRPRGVAGFVVLVVLAGIPARPDEASASVVAGARAPRRHRPASEERGDAARPRAPREQIARDVVANLGNEADAVLRRDPDRATAGAAGARLASVWARIDAAGATVAVPEYDLERMTVRLERDEGQGPPLVVADLEGTVELVTYRGSPPTVQARGEPAPYRQTLELVLADGRYLIVGSRGPTPRRARRPGGRARAGAGDRAAARERRRGVRAALPPRRVPLQDLERPGRRDGRRALLARLRRRRLARPLRRQLVLDRGRLDAVEASAAARRAARSSATSAAGSSTSAAARARTSRCAGTAASPPT